MTNWIVTYYQQIQEGTVNVGEWIRLLYIYLVEGLKNESFFFDAKKAKLAINFIENYCHHSKGRTGKLKLEVWQKALISAIFGIVNADGYRQFREIVLVIGRKNGKSLLASAIIACANWLDNEPAAETYIVAPRLEQADIVYTCFWNTTQAEPELKSRIKSTRTGLLIPESKSTIKKIAFNEKKADGFNPHCCVFDEIASWVGEAGKKQYAVFKSALGARPQPLLVSLTTSGYTNEGIYDDLVLRGTRVLLGDSSEKRLLPVLYMIDNIDLWNDLNELYKANPNLGVSLDIDTVLEDIAAAEASLSAKAEFITKRCCLKQNSTQAWLSVQAIEKSADEHDYIMSDFKSKYCIAGIDLSQTTDLTSACLLIEQEEQLYVISHFWLPAEKLSEATTRDGIPYQEMIDRGWMDTSGENYVDYHDVFNWLVSAVRDYELLPLKVGYDRYSSQYLIQELEQFGFQCDDVFQGTNLTPVIYECEGLVKDGRLHIGANQLLKIHLLDVALDKDTRAQKVKIKKLNPNAHIDGCAALLDALTVRQKYYNELAARLSNKE